MKVDEIAYRTIWLSSVRNHELHIDARLKSEIVFENTKLEFFLRKVIGCSACAQKQDIT